LLKAIGKRAAFDSEYYHAAAGVFAGVTAARELLAPSFVWRTVKSAARVESAAAIDALHGPRRMRRSSATLPDADASAIKYAESHPVATLEWGVRCALGALELATQMAISALVPHREAKR
jgi:hypothetical protein